jgi:hypothetical protein
MLAGMEARIRWRTRSVAPGKMRGHRPKAMAGQHRAWLLRRIKHKDFTRRDLNQDQYGAAGGLGAAPQKAHRQGPAQPLENATFVAAVRHDRIGLHGFSRVRSMARPSQLTSRRSKTVRRLIRSVGAKLFFLPAP